MAQKVTVALEDDLDGGPADETMRFGFEGADYEIDLSAKNAQDFRTKLEPFIEHARKAGRGPARRSARTSAGRQRSGEVRAWAQTTASRSVPAAGSRVTPGSVWSNTGPPPAKDTDHRRQPAALARIKDRSRSVS